LISTGRSRPSSRMSRSTSLPCESRKKYRSGRSPPIEPVLHDLEDDKILIEPSTQGVPGGLFGGPNSQQECRKPGVGEVNLWRFHDPFPDIFKIGWEFKDDVGAFRTVIQFLIVVAEPPTSLERVV